MKTLIYITLFTCLLAGCASTGQVEISQTTGMKAQVSAITELPAEAKAAETPRLTGGVLLAYYDPTQMGYHIRPVDPANGEAIPARDPIRLSQDKNYLPQYAYTPDGKLLVALETRGQSCEAFSGGTSCYPGAEALHLVSLPDWKDITTLLPGSGWVGTLIFSPGNERLAMLYNRANTSSLLIIDAASGEIVAQQALDFQPERVAFAQEGRTLVVYGTPQSDNPGITQPGAPRLVALDAVTLETVWEREFSGLASGSWCLEDCDQPHGQQLYAYWAPAVVFAPAENQLFILHADRDQLTRVDLVDGAVSQLQITKRQSWLERLLSLTAGVASAKGGSRGATKQAFLAAGGKQLYVLSTATDAVRNQDGYWEPINEYTEAQVIDLASGQIVDRYPAASSWLRSSPDGRFILVETWQDTGLDTQLLAAGTLEKVADFQDWEIVWAPGLDGQAALLGKRGTNTTTELALFDPQSYQVVSTWSYNGLAEWAATQ